MTKTSKFLAVVCIAGVSFLGGTSAAFAGDIGGGRASDGGGNANVSEELNGDIGGGRVSGKTNGDIGGGQPDGDIGGGRVSS